MHHLVVEQWRPVSSSSYIKKDNWAPQYNRRRNLTVYRLWFVDATWCARQNQWLCPFEIDFPSIGGRPAQTNKTAQRNEYAL
jgi:hypothetical protein